MKPLTKTVAIRKGGLGAQLDTKPKKGGDAPVRSAIKNRNCSRLHDTPPEVSPSPASGVCPTCGQRIRPKVDRKDYMARYMRDWRARKRAEKQE